MVQRESKRFNIMVHTVPHILSFLCVIPLGSYGSLCHLGDGANSFPEDLYFCSMCSLIGQGSCSSIFGDECICDEGFAGLYCDEADLDEPNFEIDQSANSTNDFQNMP